MVRLLRFDSDYMEGAHPEILRRLSEINFEKNPGYGSDDYCKSAADRIRAACGCPDARVYFLPGGTQTNATVTDALLKGYQGVVSATSGHINQSEAGAVEAYGHKIITIPEKDGKISTRSSAIPAAATWSSRAWSIYLTRPSTVRSTR